MSQKESSFSPAKLEGQAQPFRYIDVSFGINDPNWTEDILHT